MAEHIVFDYTNIASCVTAIQNIAERYKTAANKFESDYRAAVTGWSGASKNKMDQFVVGASDSVLTYMRDSVPALVNGLASMLESNANQMGGTDEQIAESIPATLGGGGGGSR